MSVAIDMAKPQRRSSAIPIALVLLAFAAGAVTAVLHAHRGPHPDATPQPPAIVFLPVPDLIHASPIEPSSCASTPPPPPVEKKIAPVPAHVHPHPPPPAPSTAAPTVRKLPPLPSPSASDIPLSPMKAVPMTPGSGGSH